MDERRFSGAAPLEERPSRGPWLIAGLLAALAGAAALVAYFASASPRASAAAPSQPRRAVDIPITVNLPPPAPGRTLPSGLRILSEVEGSGAPCRLGHSCTLAYRGFLWTSGQRGRLIDDSAKRGPFTAKPEQLIKGFSEAMQRLRAGGHSVVLIPPELGYGNRDMKDIPAGSTLLFELELLAAD